MSYPPPRNFLTTYLVWTGCSVTAIILFPPLLNITHSGGEQLGMSSWAYSVPISTIGYALISIYLLLARPKSRDYIALNVIVLFSVIGFYGWYLITIWFIDTDVITHTRHKGEDDIQTEYEYYRLTHQVRAIRHYHNAYPDSIWVEYDRFGNMTKRQAGESIVDSTPGTYE